MQAAFFDVEVRLRDLWTRVAKHCAAFELVLPGSPSFVCQAAACPVHCCKVFGIVPVSDDELQRLSRFSDLEPLELLETRDGHPLVLPELPSNRPYHLSRTADGACALLGDDLFCSQYEGRPDACRVYPHYVFFFDSASERPAIAESPEQREAMERLVSGGGGPGDQELLPVLLRHGACPGFTGPALGREEWLALVQATFQLQYEPAREQRNPAG
jgi:Fe-S-cluster containining protein